MKPVYRRKLALAAFIFVSLSIVFSSGAAAKTARITELSTTVDVRADGSIEVSEKTT